MDTRYITLAEAALLLGVGKTQAKRLLEAKKIKRANIYAGRGVLITKVSVEKERQRREKNPPKPGRPKKQGLSRQASPGIPEALREDKP